MGDFSQEPTRIGCLIAPLSAVAGFVVTTLLCAALGFSAYTSTIAGLIGAAVAIAGALKTLKSSKGGN